MPEIKFKSEISGRVDSVIAANTDLSRSAAARLAEEGNVFINGKTALKKSAVCEGDSISVSVPDPVADKAEPQNIPIEVVYEDDSLLVVNKPQGMVVHPAAGNADGTLVNALLYHCKGSLSGINGVMRPGIVHRIDKNTSGLLMVAKTDEAHKSLAEQIKNHSFCREYEAVVHGNVKKDEDTINAPIGRHPVKRKQMAVTDRSSRDATTHYSVIERNGRFTHIRLKLETGRTHQIRVHMAYIGHPVAGDDVYGPKHTAGGLIGQCLHAKKLGFIHPITGKYMEFESELPEYFKRFLKNNSLGGE